MDIASLIGVLSGLGMIFGAIVHQAELSSYVNVPGMFVVLGGTISATLLTFPLGNVLEAFRTTHTLFFRSPQDPNAMLKRMIQLNRLARSRGFVFMQKHTEKGEPEIIQKVVQLISDNMDESVIRDALRTEIDSIVSHHLAIQDVFQKMGAYAPVFGMIGTIIGLIAMLDTMEDPSQIGPAMALALTTTFYGSLLSAMIFNPAAGKLHAHMQESITNLEIVYAGALSILHHEHPLVLYERAVVHIPAAMRSPFEDHGEETEEQSESS